MAGAIWLIRANVSRSARDSAHLVPSVLHTFILHGAGQVPRDYLGPRTPQQPRGANLRVVYPSNAITLTVGATASTK